MSECTIRFLQVTAFHVAPHVCDGTATIMSFCWPPKPVILSNKQERRFCKKPIRKLTSSSAILSLLIPTLKQLICWSHCRLSTSIWTDQPLMLSSICHVCSGPNGHSLMFDGIFGVSCGANLNRKWVVFGLHHASYLSDSFACGFRWEKDYFLWEKSLMSMDLGMTF